MSFDWAKANEAANDLSRVVDALTAAGLTRLEADARDLMERLEAVLEGDSPLSGDFE
jgi:hypothetical protein